MDKIFECAKSGELKEFKLFYRKNVALDLRDSKKRSPLHLAAANGKLKII